MKAHSCGQVLDLLGEGVALVSRMKRRMLIRMVRFCRSTKLVLILASPHEATAAA
jgi:hypothetical protein